MKRVLLTACVFVCGLSPAVAAAKGGVAPPGNSAISQYTEVIPSGGGGTPTSGIAVAPASKPPPAAALALRGPGAARRELSRFVGATAPRTRTSTSTSTSAHRTKTLPLSADIGGSSPVSSVLHSLGGSGGGMGIALPLILIACLLGAAGVVVRVSRSKR